MSSKLAYICAPYSGDIEGNIKRAIEFGKRVYKLGYVPIIPHVMFPFIKDEDEKTRKWALNACLRLLNLCDMLVICDNNLTSGMKDELLYAVFCHIEIKFLDDEQEE